jgi:predicted GNAT family acetyltransferase
MEIINNKKQFRFELPLPGGEYAELDYRWLKGSMVLMHTVVPESARGKGIGGILVKYVLDYAREQRLKIIVYCPFATKYLKDHPEYNDLVDEAHRS